MSKNIWLQKKPQSVLDWLGIIFCSIGFYILLGHLNLFVGAVGKVLNILAPFATGIVIAYVLDCIVRPVHHKLLKDNPKMRWLAILIAYVAAVLIIFVLGWMVIPQVISSISGLVETLPSAAQTLFAELEAYLSAHSENETLTAFVENIIQQVQDWLKGGLTPWLYSIALTLSASVMNLVQLIKNVRFESLYPNPIFVP